MKKKNPLILFFTLLLSALAFSGASAQETFNENLPQNPRQAVRPFKIIQELGLTREQIQQIRRINQSRRPVMQAAQQRWQAARRNLDAAVYADNISDEEVNALTKDAMTAQAELLKERTQTEYMIRKVLTPEQLVRFRELRESVLQRINERKNARAEEPPNSEPQRPLNRLQQRRQARRGQ